MIHANFPAGNPLYIAERKASYEKRLQEYCENPHLCLNCRVPILPIKKQRYCDVITKKFCGRSCSATFNQLGRPSKNLGHGHSANKKLTNCIRCGKINNAGKKFCSLQCGVDYQKDKCLVSWIRGIDNGLNKDGATLRGSIRNYLLRKNCYKCSMCGWGETNPHTKKVPLQIDHIDGNWNNNLAENLRVLCPNCHSLTATYGTGNRGKGRPYYIVKKATVYLSGDDVMVT